MGTLHLNLKSKWFDMIVSGEKKEEYREIKDYWLERLVDCIIEDSEFWLPHIERIQNDKLSEAIIFKHFDTITFSNGYSKDRRQMEVDLKTIAIDFGNPLWGADEGQKYFVLKLGKILSRNF